MASPIEDTERKSQGAMRRILFSGDGSSGDLLPMVLMAREFKLAGYDVCVCGSSEFSRMAEDFGVPFEGYPHNYSKIYLEKQRTGYIHNMREKLEQTLTENPTLVHETDDRGYSFLHQLSLAGSLDGVDVCLKHGADPKQAAPNGMTPLALAKSLGWKKVKARLEQAGA